MRALRTQVVQPARTRDYERKIGRLRYMILFDWNRLFDVTRTLGNFGQATLTMLETRPQEMRTPNFRYYVRDPEVAKLVSFIDELINLCSELQLLPTIAKAKRIRQGLTAPAIRWGKDKEGRNMLHED